MAPTTERRRIHYYFKKRCQNRGEIECALVRERIGNTERNGEGRVVVRRVRGARGEDVRIVATE